MKRRKLTVISLVFTMIFSLGIGMAFMLHAVDASADNLLLASSNMSYTYNYEASNGTKGVCLSTENSQGTAKLGNVYDGSLELTLLPVATQDNAVNFQRMHVDFQPVAGGNYFRFSYLTGASVDQGKAALIKCYWGETPISGATVDLNKIEAVTVGFDSETMTMFYRNGEETTVLMDFRDGAALSKAFGTHNTIAEAGQYTVSVTVDTVTSGKTASVLLSEINGQKLVGKPIMNSKGANIVRAQLYNGLVNTKYTVNTATIDACDVLEGVMAFNGKIYAYEPDGTEVEVTDGSFVPDKVGIYMVGLRAKDSNGLLGEEKKFSVNVVAAYTATEIEFAFPMEDITVGKNTDVQLSAASATNKQFGGKLPVSVTVTHGADTVYECENMENNDILTLTDNGTYHVKYEAKDSVGITASAEYTITVSDGYSLKLTEEVKDVYVTGTLFTVPTYETDAESVATNLVMADGRSSSSQCVKLESLGTYTLQYVLTGAKGSNTVEYSFDVKARASELFETARGMTVENAASTPAYMDVQATGAMLTGSMVNASATYKNVINLTDKTKNDLLAEFYVCPEERLTLELLQFSVRLTDIYDESNCVTIVVRRCDWGYNNMTTLQATYADNALAGYTNITSSMYGKWKAWSDGVYNYEADFSSTVAIYWDNEENAFYVNSRGGRALVADLDDPATFGVNLFKGFKTGEVKMTISFDNPQMAAHLLVREVAGQKFGTEYVEERVAPSVLVQWNGATPYACVGKEYTLFDAYGVDNVDGTLRAQTAVYFKNNGLRERVVINDGKFVPKQAGSYEVVYKTVNSAGQTAQKTLIVEAKDEKDIEPLKMTVPEYETTALQGETLSIGLPTVSGASGYSAVKVTVSCDGTQVAEFSENVGTVVLEDAGIYTINYSATDLYTGFNVTQEIKVTVTAPEKPVFEPLRLPTAFIAGKSYILPMATAYDYSTGEQTNSTVKLFVNNEEKPVANAMTFNAGTVTIEYRATNADGATDKLTFNVPVIDVKNSGKAVYLAGYFLYDESVEVKAEALSLFFLSDKDTEIQFINKIAADLFSIDFSVAAQYANMSAVELVLTDSLNPTQKVVLTIGKLDSADATSSLKINGIAANPVSGALGATGTKGQISIKLSGTSVVDGSGAAQALVNADGSAFGGFTSGYVYADLRIVGAEEGKTSAITLASIVNQAFGSATADRGKPNIVLCSKLPLLAELGAKVDLSGAFAYDVLDPETQFYVSVTCSGKTVVAEKAYTGEMMLELNAFGKYSIIFRAVDTSNRSYEALYNIIVYNREPPVITVSKDRVESAKVGETVKLATYESDGNVSVIVIGSDGILQIVKDGQITVTRAGTYRVFYYATNSDGAVATATYDILVK